MRFTQTIAITAVIMLLLLLLSITGYSSLFSMKNSSAEGAEGRTFFVPEGVTLRWIADSLEDQGLIRSGTLFIAMGKLLLSEKEIMAGEYIFPPKRNLFDILLAFKYGRVNYRKITIPAGFNIDQIGKMLESEGLMDEVTFWQLTRDRDLIELLGPYASNGVSNLEGFLYPDTYYFFRGGNPKKMARKMVLRFKEVFGPELEERASQLNMTVKDVIALASLIEKEAVIEEERPLISAVFHNRLKRNMPLQSDPTVIYALGSSFDGDLKREHLTLKSSYNTYTRRGLPPGPIGNPGIESIRAALYPTDVDYLYFVSKNDGTHHFSDNFKEHDKAVAIYQKPLALKKTSR